MIFFFFNFESSDFINLIKEVFFMQKHIATTFAIWGGGESNNESGLRFT
jgi:hypothetical protein